MPDIEHGPFCARCGADTKGDPAVYLPASKQGGLLYYCHVCHPPVRFNATALRPTGGMESKRYSVGVDHPAEERGPWQTDDLDAAYLIAGLESRGGTAVVCEFDAENNATVLAVYEDGRPRPRPDRTSHE